MAAVLACGPEAALSHGSAAALWEIRPARRGLIDVSVPAHVVRNPKGITVHRRKALAPADVTRHRGIPLTAPICTLIDIAAQLEPPLVEAAINEADLRRLANPEQLRRSLDECAGRPGVTLLRRLLDRHTFALTRSELERLFLPLARKAGLSKPLTQYWLNGFRVDFFWPDLGLVVETDGLRYHRTPVQQARDLVRDQAHVEAGLVPLRFTHHQIRFQPEHVRRVLAEAARQCETRQRRSAVTFGT
jgi:very-short-patch-repair endonuclease